MPPEQMLPFAAHVVSGPFSKGQISLTVFIWMKWEIERKFVCEFWCGDCRQQQTVELWELELVSHTAQIHAWLLFYNKVPKWSHLWQS